MNTLRWSLVFTAAVAIVAGCENSSARPETIGELADRVSREVERATSVLRKASPPGTSLSEQDFAEFASDIRAYAAQAEAMGVPPADQAEAIRSASDRLGERVKELTSAAELLIADATTEQKMSLAQALLPLTTALQEFSFSADPMFKAMKQNRPSTPPAPTGFPPSSIPGGVPPMPSATPGSPAHVGGPSGMPMPPGIPPRPPANETPDQMIARQETTHGKGTAVLVRFTNLPASGPTMDMGVLSSILRTAGDAREASVRTSGSTGFAVVAPVADFGAFCNAIDLGGKSCDEPSRTIEIEFDHSKLPLTRPR